MRLTAFIAAFGIILLGSYWVVIYGYPHFFSSTRSHLAAQLMTFCALAFTSLSVIWAVKKLP